MPDIHQNIEQTKIAKAKVACDESASIFTKSAIRKAATIPNINNARLT
jgi:hypothetical protein